MDKFIFESLKNAAQFINSPAFSQLAKIIPPAEVLNTLSKDALIASKIAPPPEIVENLNKEISLATSFNIPQLNDVLQPIASLPRTNFQEIKNIIYENRSQIYDTAKANMNTVSPTIEQTNQDNNDKTLIIPEQAAELIHTVDESIDFPQPDSDKQIHIEKSHTDYFKIISLIFTIISTLISIANLAYSVYQNNTTTELLKKNHSEQLQATYQQTEQLENLDKKTPKSLQLLEQIEKNTSPSPNKD